MLICNFACYSDTLVSVVGSLKRNVLFWEEAGASEFVLSVISNGFRLPFVQLPPKFFFPNNKSALRNSEFVAIEIACLCLKGCVSEVQSKPHFVSPLSVAENAEGKKRLIHDLSVFNFFLPRIPVKYEGIETLLPYLSKNAVLFKFDMKSGYHHIEIAPEHRKYLGFSWFFAGKLWYFVFNVLPFGLSLAPLLFTKVMRVPVLYWRQKGFKIVLYLDDGIVCVQAL